MAETKEEIEQRMDELAREYGRTERGDPRRAEIAKQLSMLCLMLDRLAAAYTKRAHQTFTVITKSFAKLRQVTIDS
jgi:hypothetical protein